MTAGIDILAVGSVAYDDVESPLGKRTNQLGGSSTFFSLSACNFAKVGITGIVGNDFADEHRALLLKRGVNIDGLQQVDGDTMHWSGSYVEDLNNAVTLSVKLNVFEQFKPQLNEIYASARTLFLGNIAPTIQIATLKSMARRPKIVACDTMDFWINNQREQLGEMFGLVDIILINETEAMSFTRTTSVPVAARELLRYGARCVLIKRGEYGVVLFAKDFQFAVPAYPMEVVADPTGAGDSFAGGFLGALSKLDTLGENDLKRGAVIGSTMASFTVSEFGTDKLVGLTEHDIKQRYNEFRKLTQFEAY